MDRYAWAKLAGGTLAIPFGQWMVRRLDAGVVAVCTSCADRADYKVLQWLAFMGAFLPLIVGWIMIVEHLKSRSRAA